MTINPNVGHVTTSSEYSFASSAYISTIHCKNDTLTGHSCLDMEIIQRSFSRGCPAVYVWVCLWIGFLTYMMFAFICCPLNCMMIARCYEYDLKNILGLATSSCWHRPSHERRECLFSRALKYCQHDYQEDQLLQNLYALYWT